MATVAPTVVDDKAWFEYWPVFLLLCAVSLAAAIFAVVPRPSTGQLFATWWVRAVLGGAVAVGWPLRTLGLEQQKAKRQRSAEERAGDRAVAAAKNVAGSARDAMTFEHDDYYRHVAEHSPAHLLPNKELRVGLYVVERAEAVEESEPAQELSYYLRLAGDNRPARPMTATVMPTDETQACKEMVARARGGVTLVVPDVTKRQGDWTELPDTPEQRNKYMSFISVPVVRWHEDLDENAPPAGLLCVDSRIANDLTEREAPAVRVLADVMALGFNRPSVRAPDRPKNLPQGRTKRPQSKTLSGSTPSVDNKKSQ